MKQIVLGLLLCISYSLCSQSTEEKFTSAMQRHLDAVSNRDLPVLKSTLSQDSSMILILPQSKVMTTAREFLDYHRDWFAVGEWTFDTKILSIEVGTTHGFAVVEVMYREPERNGEPYYNKLIVSYDLRLEGGEWKIVKDHACSIEKSTDP